MGRIKASKSKCFMFAKYTDIRRAHNRYYNGFIALSASAGALGFSINEYIPFITSLLIGFVSITKSIMPNFLQSEPELSELDNLSNFYVRYMNHLENIWYDLITNI